MRDRDSLVYMLVMMKILNKLDVIRFEMSQDQSWRGSGYFWPRS
jgi:hypothetical protein